MDIQVVLTENDPKLGKRGEIIKVSSGYAQNYLFPQHKAQPVTAANVKAFEQEKLKQSKDEAERLARAKARAEKLRATPLEIFVTAGEGDRLFGAVTAQHIADALTERGIPCDRKMVHLEEPIKKIGRYEIEFRLHPEVIAKLQVQTLKKI